MESFSTAAIGRTSPEAGSLRIYFDDDDDESYFDLNVNTTTSTDFYFTLALSPLRDPHFSLQDVFADGSIVPPKPLVDKAPPPPDVHSPLPLHGNLGFGAQRRSGSTRSHDGTTGRARPLKRGASTVAAAATGVLNLLIKFPSEKIRTAFLTFARSLSRSKHLSSSSSSASPRSSHQRDKLHKSSSSSPPSKRPLYRTLVASLHRLFSSQERSSDDGRRRVVDISSDDSGLLRAVAEAVNTSSTGDKTGVVVHQSLVRTRSAPCSVQSSPRSSWGVHGEEVKQVKTKLEKVVERDGSVSAAIAHCKGGRV